MVAVDARIVIVDLALLRGPSYFQAHPENGRVLRLITDWINF